MADNSMLAAFTITKALIFLMGSSLSKDQEERGIEISKKGKERSVVIIGAGFSGLSAAQRLAEKGHQVVILEALDSMSSSSFTFYFFSCNF
jgi:ribulose 1,5-bisphosphate synthetase/thiazole synthase